METNLPKLQNSFHLPKLDEEALKSFQRTPTLVQLSDCTDIITDTFKK